MLSFPFIFFLFFSAVLSNWEVKAKDKPKLNWIEFLGLCRSASCRVKVGGRTTAENCKAICATKENCKMAKFLPVKGRCFMCHKEQLRKTRKKKCTQNNRYDFFIKAVIECDVHGKKCKHFAICHSEGGHRRCRCRIGYKGDGKICVDINECATYNDLCGEYASCVNTVGSYKCVCDKGYSGDGKTCIKAVLSNWEVKAKDKPKLNWIEYFGLCRSASCRVKVEGRTTAENCKAICATKENCKMAKFLPVKGRCSMCHKEQLRETHKKKCTKNYRYDFFIKAVIECDVHGKKCKHFAICRSEGGHRRCRCRIGYKGDGKICDDINECATYNDLCGEYASCVNTVGSYKCVCNKGYSGDGKTCIKEEVKHEKDDVPENKKSNTFHTMINLFHNSATSIKCSQNLGRIATVICLILVFL